MIRFLLQMTGYFRQQLTRLIQQYIQAGIVQPGVVNKAAGFKQKYSDEDIILLTKMDERYDTPSGAVIKIFCKRACTFCKFAIRDLTIPLKIQQLRPLELFCTR